MNALFDLLLIHLNALIFHSFHRDGKVKLQLICLEPKNSAFSFGFQSLKTIICSVFYGCPLSKTKTRFHTSILSSFAAKIPRSKIFYAVFMYLQHVTYKCSIRNSP